MVTKEEMHAYGYSWDGMVPIDKIEAINFWEIGWTVYLLYEDGTEAEAESIREIIDYPGMFGVPAIAIKTEIMNLERFLARLEPCEKEETND